MPTMSSLRLPKRTGGDTRHSPFWHAHIAAAPIGRLIQKIQRHEKLWATTPPTSGPLKEAIAQTAEMYA